MPEKQITKIKTLSTCLLLFLATIPLYAQISIDGRANTYDTSVTTQTITQAQVIELGLPVLIIETIGQEEPTCDYVFAPEGYFGIGTTNKTKVPGRVLIVHQSDTLFDSKPYAKDAGGMTISIRGNTSAYYSEKKPYKIKLEKKNDLLCRGDSSYYDKNWALISDGNDVLHTMIGNLVNKLVGMPYTPAYRYVNVIMNNDYRGIYMLTETIRRNADCRLNVSKQSGYIIERDAYWWNEPLYFTTPMNMEYTFKYPDDEDVTEQQKDYIHSVVESMEQSIEDGTYEQHIDLQSFAAWMLAHDLLGTNDAGGSNIYMTKYDDSDTTLLEMSTLWDFGSVMQPQRQKSWSAIHESSFFYYPRLFSNENTAFVNAYRNLWNKLSPTIFDDIISVLNNFKQTETAQLLQRSRPYEYQRWNYSGPTVADNVAKAIAWFSDRRKWLANEMNTTQIDHTRQSESLSSGVYTLSGLPVGCLQALPRGIYIRNGQKIIVK